MVMKNNKEPKSIQLSSWFLIFCILTQQLFPSYIWSRNNITFPIERSYLKNQLASVIVPEIKIIENVQNKPIPGGPDQPEVQSFTPIGVSDMVNPFTGDFSYNIPLVDVDGYPINLAYTAGISMDEEASWVGLGWNLNPGVVNRMMRGLPDEFDGTEKIEKEYNVKNNWTVGVNGGVDVELFGFKAGEIVKLPPGDNGTIENTFSLGASLGINYNSYNGYSSEVSISPSISLGRSAKPDMNFGLGLSGSSSGGASLSPSFSINSDETKDKTRGYGKGMNIGAQFNSRGGLQAISFKTTNALKSSKNSAKKLNGSGSVSYQFGQTTFSPQISMPMNHAGFTFSFKTGATIWGFDGSYHIGGHYSNSWLKDKKMALSAYGYFNMDKGQNDENGMLDFTRENDGAFTKHTPTLPLASLNYDLFSASGQGVSGSYRAFRNDIGYVFDPLVSNGGISGSLGLEIGSGSLLKTGVDIAVTYSNSKSLSWRTLNEVKNKLKYTSFTKQFREANEMSVSSDPDHFERIGGAKAVRFRNNTMASLRNDFIDENGESIAAPEYYSKGGTTKRNQLFTFISRAEQAQGLGVDVAHPQLYTLGNALDHHIGEMTLVNTEGARYVYGIAAYNKMQKDVSFAVSVTKIGNRDDETYDHCQTGLIEYNPTSDASPDNKNGIDHYYSSMKTPAYAHSFLLTSVLNSDYSDIDVVKGPSKGDLGGYIKFSYQKIDNYKWKTPMDKTESLASFDEGLNSDNLDNKAHYTYGEKELWYVDKIETKNHVLLFYTSDRFDGHGINGEHGVVSASEPSMQKLDSIVLYSLPDFERNAANAIPLKKVHLVYDYSLCKEYAQNVNSGANSGKLTLKKVFFTYQNSQKGRYNKYEFDYSAINPDYNLKSVDRWGNYKSNIEQCDYVHLASGLRTTDFPYTGFDQAAVNQNVSAWNLTKIHLPSGGRIEVDYESDDYAYVQHQAASQMFKIVGVQKNSNGDVKTVDNQSLSHSGLFGDDVKNAKVYFEMIPEYPNASDYVKAGDEIYFRALMNFRAKIGELPDGADNDNDPDKVFGHDFVPGYAKVMNVSQTFLNGQAVGVIEFEPAGLIDNDFNGDEFNPIAVAAIQYGRLHLQRMLPPSNQGTDNELGNIADLANSLLGAFTSYKELFTGPNRPLYDAEIGTELAINKSWLRLKNPNHAKLGGGHRVKEIRIFDAWDELTNNEMEGYHYGQKYSYTLADGTSSGVAAYEPQMGQDENVWKKPVANNKRNLLAPDTRNYQEGPFGESYFPSPTVGYSVVTIQDLPRAGVERTATGKVVHEFYTAKEFPTVVKRTGIDPKRLYFPSLGYFFTLSIDEMSASQGFVVEKNDMHGKAKSQKVYAQGQTEPISSVEYFYQSEDLVLDGISVKHLTNNVLTINSKGETKSSTIGLDYDAVADFRKSTSNTISGSVDMNFNAVPVPPVVLPVFTIMGSGSLERTAFRSATFTKVIDRFGILSNTVAKDLGSRVETNNLAYDSETGEVLLTQTTTDFNDKVYSFSYPAHWYYNAMGQAYLNTDYVLNANGNMVFTDGINNSLNSLNTEFTNGDEVIMNSLPSNARKKAWVVEINESHLKLVDKFGNPINETTSYIKVYRSGRKNLQSTPIGSIITRTNPLDNLQGNIFKNVLQASSVEFSEDWRTFCECFNDPNVAVFTTNPYVKGLKGNWRPKASFVHLSDRTQTFENENSNIRVDGVFSSFNPFYKFKNGKLVIDRQNWTSPSFVTEFSPFGQALETQDALNRYSASSFGYNQTFALAVGTNTRYKQLGFDGFEDYDFKNCSDNHFKLSDLSNLSNQSHTGRYSLKVTAANPITYSSVLNENCDPVVCNLQHTFVLGGTTKDPLALFTVVNGQAPYSFEYEIISGTPIINLSAAGNGLEISNNFNEMWTIKVYVTDANGCTTIKEIQRITTN